MWYGHFSNFTHFIISHISEPCSLSCQTYGLNSSPLSLFIVTPCECVLEECEVERIDAKNGGGRRVTVVVRFEIEYD